MGVTSKLCVGGGEGTCHSNPVARHGLAPARGPYFQDQVRYTSGKASPTPKMVAPAVEMMLRNCHSGGYAAYRRGMPSQPSTNCGKNVRLKPKKTISAAAFAKASGYILPLIFGHQ